MRNFLHNISDILLAILIVAAAATIIFWRMQVIMAYPQKVAEQNAANNKVEVEQQVQEAEEAK